MSLGKRHIGRRVAGVGVAVALMVIGLEAPAFAAAPVVSSFTPTSGPATGGCIVVVTGTGLDDFPAAATYRFDFVLNVAPNTVVQATDYVIISDTEAWVRSPALVAGNSYNIKATNPGGTSTSSTAFLATNGAGGCVPTITSFTPACGLHGSTTVITGTNLLRGTVAVPGTPFEGSIGGGIVSFSPYSSDATHTVPDVDEATTLSVVVSSDAADGPIKVTTKGTTAVPTDGMSAFSTVKFEVPPPDCTAVVEGHPRAITFKLKKSGKASGVVSSTEDPAFTDCVSAVPVKIQKKKKGGGWKTKANATTSDTGSYSAKIKGKPGKYRALAPKIAGTTAADDCLKAKSATRTIKK
jgi:hypothetical protein